LKISSNQLQLEICLKQADMQATDKMQFW
jgi:hypothetical protein